MCQPLILTSLHLHTAKVSVRLLKIFSNKNTFELIKNTYISHNNTITKKNTLLKVPVKF